MCTNPLLSKEHPWLRFSQIIDRKGVENGKAILCLYSGNVGGVVAKLTGFGLDTSRAAELRRSAWKPGMLSPERATRL